MRRGVSQALHYSGCQVLVLTWGFVEYHQVAE
jgi:hypothetical protein